LSIPQSPAKLGSPKDRVASLVVNIDSEVMVDP
jgi:hypothetical protein